MYCLDFANCNGVQNVVFQAFKASLFFLNVTEHSPLRRWKGGVSQLVLVLSRVIYYACFAGDTSKKLTLYLVQNMVYSCILIKFVFILLFLVYIYISIINKTIQQIIRIFFIDLIASELCLKFNCIIFSSEPLNRCMLDFNQACQTDVYIKGAFSSKEQIFNFSSITIPLQGYANIFSCVGALKYLCI